MIVRLLDRLFGRRCHLCGQRVFNRDVAMHFYNEHAGDRR